MSLELTDWDCWSGLNDVSSYGQFGKDDLLLCFTAEQTSMDEVI